MQTKFSKTSIKKYSELLSQRIPVPGGGSAAALVGTLGAALISMVAHYSLGKGKPPAIEKSIKEILKKSEKIRSRFLVLVDLDAQAYLNLVKSRKGTAGQKVSAKKRAREVPLEISRLCYEGMQLTPYLVEHGNKYLLSDVEVAVDFLSAAFNSAIANVRVNQ